MRRKLRHVPAAAVMLVVASLVSLGTGPAQAASAAPGHATPASATAATAAPSPAVHAKPAPHAGGLKPVVRTAVRHDTSPALRSMKPLKLTPARARKLTVLPLRSPPHAIGVGGAAARTADVQRAGTATTGTMPSFGQNFDGVANISNISQVLPPDTNMAVGPSDIVQTVNTSFAVYSKSGSTLLGPEDLGTLWQGFGGECDPSVDPAADGGDVVSLYDEQANRFIVTQLAYPQLAVGEGGFHECIAVSQTGDPTGAWYRYDFLFSNTTLNDYPKFGVWPDAYYESNNDFADGQYFTGVTVTAYDRAQMLAGQQATMVQFTTGPQYGSLLPSSTEGSTIGQNPPPGAPDPYLMSCDPNAGGPCTSSQLDEWDFHVDWASPGLSTFGDSGDPNTTLPVAAFNSNLCDYSRDCIPQPGPVGLDALSDRLMYQSAYRDLGHGTQAIVVNQTVNVSASGGNQAGVRWYELTNTGSGWAVGQQGTYAPDSDNRWMGSANIDASGDIAVGYSVSSASTYPSIRVAGRLAGDPAGQLSQGEETLIAGGGSQTSLFSRWGDYSAMQVDPADGCTFWYTSEYYSATSDSNWQTRIGSFKFPSCTSGPHGTITGTVTDASTGKPVAGAVVSTMSGATVTDSQGHYSLVLPAGSYQATYSGFGYATQTQNLQVTDGGTTTQDAALAPVAMVHVTGTVTDGSGHGWPLHASIAIQGDPNGPVWTNPATGGYSVDLPQNATWPLTVTTDLPGYQVVSDSLSVGTSDLTHDISVPVDEYSCTAPGYAQQGTITTALKENFDDYPGDGGTSPPPGWTVDNKGSGSDVWVFDNPNNQTGGSGNFAFVQGNTAPPYTTDTSLTTPVLDLSGETSPVISFQNSYHGGNSGQTGAVDVSTDGGQTWSTIWEHHGDNVPSPPGASTETVQAPQAGGKSSVQFRFHYTSPPDGWYWEVDDVLVQSQNCDLTPGGLVVGRVTDANTGNGIDGATVTSAGNPQGAVTTTASADPGIGDGYYWMFSPLTGSQQFTFTAAKHPYQSASQTVAEAPDTAAQANFALTAPQLSVTPSSISSSQVLGSTTRTIMTIKNTGTGPAHVQLDQRRGAFQILRERGAPVKLVRLGDDGGDGGPLSPRSLGGQRSDVTPRVNAGQSAGPAWSTIASYPTAVLDNGVDFIGGKEYSVGGVDANGSIISSGYVYDPGTGSWTAIASMPVAREKPGVVANDSNLYVTGGWNASGTPIAETDVYDPSTGSWSTAAANPHPTAAAGVASTGDRLYFVGGCAGDCSASSTVEVYDPSTDSWSSAAPYPHPDAWLSCGGINSEVYCAGGANDNVGIDYSDAYVYDPGTNSWSPIANLPFPLWGSVSGAADGLLVVSSGIADGLFITNQGYAYDPSTNTWASIPNAQFPVYRGGGSCGFYKIGGTDDFPVGQPDAEALSGMTQCGPNIDIPWMSVSPRSATLQPGQSVNVTITLSATTARQVAQPGTYPAQIAFEQDTPYEVSAQNVTMNVTPPRGWGKIAGTVTGTECAGNTTPLQSVVSVTGKKGFSMTVDTTPKTDPNGNYYAFWGPAGDSPYTMTATAAAGWVPHTQVASIRRGRTTTVDFALTPTTC